MTAPERQKRPARLLFDPSLLPAWPDLAFEMALWQAGLPTLAGIDEAGRGALAGPVAAAAVILPASPDVAGQLLGVNDSKQLSPSRRSTLAEVIRSVALGWAVGFASAEEIDAIGIMPATRLAASRAVSALPLAPQHLLLDCLFLPDYDLPQTSLIKGDCRSLSIAAASILAKTSRDALMFELDQSYPGYSLGVHKGYGTALHRQALERLGPAAVHRRSFTLNSRRMI